MNQILQVQENRRNSNSVDTKKVVLFFAVSIIIFGIILLGQGAYSVYQSKLNEKVTPTTPGNSGNIETPEYTPTITLTKTEDNKVILNVESEIAISHIIYNWNNETAQTLEETGKTNAQEVIDIPTGENTLNISVIDSNGKETKKSETFILEASKPVIELAVVGNDIKITVTSEVELSYVTYKWNSEEEKKQDMITYEDRTKFEKLLEIPKGQNTLKILAVDVNKNQTEKSQEIKGVTKAKTSVIAKGNYLDFTVTGEENIKTVEFEFNGKKYLMNTDTFGETNTVHYKMPMVSGWNYLKIISTTQSGAQDTSIWKYEYKAQ